MSASKIELLQEPSAPAPSLANYSFIEGKLQTVVIGKGWCVCQVAVSCPSCGHIMTISLKVPASLKRKLIPLLLKNVRIVRAGEKWECCEMLRGDAISA